MFAQDNTALIKNCFIFLCFFFRTEYKRVYKSLLRGCLKRPQRNQQNLSANCVDCESTRKYVKNSIELFHHFSNPSLNRRWICDKCDTDNNSVTWHCLICDTVSYLAPIYKETLNHRKLPTSHHYHHHHHHHHLPHQQLLHSSSSNNSSFESQILSDNKSNCLKRNSKKAAVSTYFRRTQSLTTEKSSFSCRSCHICYVNTRKDIFNLPDTFMNRYSSGSFAASASSGIGGGISGTAQQNSDDIFGKFWLKQKSIFIFVLIKNIIYFIKTIAINDSFI